MALPMEKNGQFMDNYLFNRKFIASKTRLKMLCHVALICTIYCITDMICTVACQEIEVVRFLGSFHLCLFLSYVNHTTKSRKIIRKLSSDSEYRISITEDKFLITRIIVFLIMTFCYHPA